MVKQMTLVQNIKSNIATLDHNEDVDDCKIWCIMNTNEIGFS